MNGQLAYARSSTWTWIYEWMLVCCETANEYILFICFLLCIVSKLWGRDVENFKIDISIIVSLFRYFLTYFAEITYFFLLTNKIENVMENREYSIGKFWTIFCLFTWYTIKAEDNAFFQLNWLFQRKTKTKIQLLNPLKIMNTNPVTGKENERLANEKRRTYGHTKVQRCFKCKVIDSAV